jgi:hypothetical protein
LSLTKAYLVSEDEVHAQIMKVMFCLVKNFIVSATIYLKCCGTDTWIQLSVFYLNGWWVTMATTSIFVAAAATDWLDGYIARRVCNPLYSRMLFPVAGLLLN